MSKQFRTNPEGKKTSKKRRPRFRKTDTHEKALKFFDYRESVAKELIGLGIHFRSAEIAVLDYGSKVHEAMVNQLTPKQTAVTMIDEVRRIYVRKEYTRVVSSVGQSGDL